MEFFEEKEFACKCGCSKGYKDMNKMFIGKILAARRIAGVPFVLNSAIRCRKHNADEGGSETSAHLIGLAVDIRIISSRDRFKIVRALLLVGFNRIGIGKDFVHVDDAACEIKPPNVMWTYYGE